MNTLKKQDIERFKDLIDSVKVANDSDVVLFATSEKQCKMFEDMIPGVRVQYIGKCQEVCESNDKVYIIPCEYKQIKY